jgi:hypothetical protein
VKRLKLVNDWSHSVWVTFKHADGVTTCPTANASVTISVSAGPHSSYKLPVRCHAIKLPHRPIFQTAFSLHPGCSYTRSQMGKKCGETEFAWAPTRDPNCCLDAGHSGGLGSSYRNASDTELHHIWRRFASFVTAKSLSPMSAGARELVDPEDYTLFNGTANMVSISGMPCSGDGHDRNCSDADVEAVRQWTQNQTTIHAVREMQAAGLQGLSVYGFDEIETLRARVKMGEMFGVVRSAFPKLRTMTCAENLPLHDAAALKALNVTDVVIYSQYIDRGNLASHSPRQVDVPGLREAGLTVWYYTADSPYHPWANLRLDNDLIDGRMQTWIAAHEQAQGYLCV